MWDVELYAQFWKRASWFTINKQLLRCEAANCAVGFKPRDWWGHTVKEFVTGQTDAAFNDYFSARNKRANSYKFPLFLVNNSKNKFKKLKESSK